MTVIRCTQKLLAEIDTVAELDATVDPLDEWYANLTLVRRRKVIVFLHAQTRFVAVALKPPRRQSQSLPNLLAESLSRALAAESVDAAAITQLTQRIETTQIARTADRRVLGCMNDVIRLLGWHLSEVEGEELHEKTTEVVKLLNRMPWVNRTPSYAIDGLELMLHRDGSK